MTGQQLKNSILQLAIQGKLVPQCPDDEPASVLLQRIRKEKEQLVKDCKLKKKDLISEPITDEEKPFDIPESWEWCRIENISESYIGLTYSPSEVADNGTVVLRSSNIKEGKIDLSDIVRVNKPISEKLIVRENDILLCARNGSKKLVGKSAIIPSSADGMSFGAFMAICKTPYYRYVHLFLQSDLFYSQLREVSGTTTINQLTQKSFNNFLIPLPPLSEQHRIVAKIEELMPLVEEYDKAQKELNVLNEKLPEQLKKSILQQAIMGKLVPQDPADEPASALLQRIRKEKEQLVKDGKLKKKDLISEPITDEEKPFDIPESWEWCRLGEIVKNRDSERIPLSVSVREQQHNRIYDYYGPGGAFDKVDGYIFDKRLMLIGEDGANLLTRTKPNAFFAEGKYWVNNHVHVLDSYIEDDIILEYIAMRINGMSLADYVTGTAQPKMNQEKMNSIPIPLPPLSEQQRIVAKIEELFAQLESL